MIKAGSTSAPVTHGQPWELTRLDIRIDPELTILDDGRTINAYIECWFDPEAKFGIALSDDEWINLYADYNVDTEALSLYYQVDAPYETGICAYEPVGSESRVILTMMEERCHTEHNCSLKNLVCSD